MRLRGLRSLRLLLAVFVAAALFVGSGAQTHAASMEQSGSMQQQNVCPSGCTTLPETPRPEKEDDKQQPQPDKSIPAYVQFQQFYEPKKILPSPSFTLAVIRPPDQATLSVFRI